MFYSAIGFLLTLFMAFTIIPAIAFLMRMFLILFLTRIYWRFSEDKSPANLLRFSMKVSQPLGFLTALFHGYAALWMGVVFFKGLDLTLDLFMPVSLAVAFIWFGLQRIKTPAEASVEFKNNIRKDKDGNDILVLNPGVPSSEDEEMGEDPDNFNRRMQERLKENTKEFMKGNTIVNLIGRVTGVVMASLSMIPL